MTTIDPTALLRLANAATPGPYNLATAPHEGEDKAGYLTGTLDPDSDAPLWLTWAETDREGLAYVVPFLTGDGPRSEANARYIAALDPDTVRALVKAYAAADEVLELHHEVVNVRTGGSYCATCFTEDEQPEPYPCPTRRAIDGGGE